MNRRQVLRGLAALPVASALSSYAKHHDEAQGASTSLHPVEVHLDGAFSLVIQRHKANSVFAFSIRDPKQPHRFLTYGLGRKPGVDAVKNYHFNLSAEGLESNAKPEIKAGLEDFTAETENWHLHEKANLVSLELPCPRSISFSGHRERIVFASGREGWMPKNHILKYQAKDLGKVKLICRELGDQCQPSPDSPPGTSRFFFEVGPSLGRDPMHRHAVEFFNYMLAASFPDLKERYRLRSFGHEHREKKYSALAPRLVPAVLSPQTAQARLEMASYTLDCDFGGMLVGTSSGPTG